jgi:AmmeMemoRadiSam system protein B
VAGTFYPGDAENCRLAAAQLVQAGRSAVIGRIKAPGIGAIVPHAGWICSGAIAAEAIAALAIQRPKVDLVVVFGAIHTPVPVDRSVLDTHTRWATPQAMSAVTDIRRRLSEMSSRFLVDDRFHQREHAVEVELPLIQTVWPGAMILPVEVPPSLNAIAVGESVASAVAEAGLSEVYLASSDLTHYGPNYRFAPVGVGEPAMQWELENDRRLLQIVTEMAPQRVIPEVQMRMNACGAGAITAMLAASMVRGARSAVVLRHQNSYQTLAAVAPQRPDNAVGYAAVWVG